MIKVEYADHMGSDLSVVNAARRSFSKKSEWGTRCVTCGGTTSYGCTQRICHGQFVDALKEKDKELIRFLARGLSSPDWDQLVVDVSNCGSQEEAEKLIHKIRGVAPHDSPLNSCAMSFNVSVPLFVARQLTKHEYLCWSEVSRRYVTDGIEFFNPEWREAPKDKKQGSGKVIVSYNNEQNQALWHKNYAISCSTVAYEDLLREGFAPEQARMILPQNIMVEATWTGLLGAWVKFINLRTKPDVQEETREVAERIKDLASSRFPVSIQEFCK